MSSASRAELLQVEAAAAAATEAAFADPWVVVVDSSHPDCSAQAFSTPLIAVRCSCAQPFSAFAGRAPTAHAKGPAASSLAILWKFLRVPEEDRP